MKADSVVKIIVVALNKPPVWLTVPDVSFKEGTAGSFDLSPFVSDPQGVPMTLSVASGTLPAGVTLQGMALVYDGSGTASTEAISLLTTAWLREHHVPALRAPTVILDHP